MNLPFLFKILKCLCALFQTDSVQMHDSAHVRWHLDAEPYLIALSTPCALKCVAIFDI